MLPLPGAPSSTWRQYKARLAATFEGADPRVCTAFWLFGLINNVFYVLILSAALDLVGTSVPKATVLLSSIIPSLAVKLAFPYFMDFIPYSVRILLLAAFSTCGMLVVALSEDKHVGAKLAGIVLANMSAGAGEVNFLSLVHFYGPFSLAAWGSGTGGAGLIGAGAYALATTALGLSVRATLLASTVVPVVMLAAYFVVLPRTTLHVSEQARLHRSAQPDSNSADEDDTVPRSRETEGLLSQDPDSPSRAEPSSSRIGKLAKGLRHKFQRAQGLIVPYMVPLFLVFAAEYTINQGVAPTLLFPLEKSPFKNFRDFYPVYNATYQVGVFISRSSLPFVRIRALYLPSVLQVVNLIILTLHALWPFLPSFWLVAAVVLFEGLLGGLVYVSAFADIREQVPAEDREFSLGAAALGDALGICTAGFVGMVLETRICSFQVEHGRNYCRQL